MTTLFQASMTCSLLIIITGNVIDTEFPCFCYCSCSFFGQMSTIWVGNLIKKINVIKIYDAAWCSMYNFKMLLPGKIKLFSFNQSWLHKFVGIIMQISKKDIYKSVSLSDFFSFFTSKRTNLY